MLSKGDVVFFRLSSAATRADLRRGSVEEIQGLICRIALDEPCAGIEEGGQLLLNFERNREFMQISAHVLTKHSDDPLVVTVELRGKPVSAESRQCYRVSCLAADIAATFAGETGCEVIDVSATGFAVYASGRYAIGQGLEAALHYEGRDYAGEVTIQSIRQMNPKKTRYGVHCVASPQNTLANSLSSISLAIQREQLRRLSGTD